MLFMNRTKANVMWHTPLVLTCEDMHKFLDDYLAGELPAKQHIAFSWHIRMCKCCKDYLEAYRRSIELSRESFYEELGENCEDLPESLVESIIAAKREPEE